MTSLEKLLHNWNETSQIINNKVDKKESGSVFKMFTVIGYGGTEHEIVFPEPPKIVLSMYGYASNGNYGLIQPFAWGSNHLSLIYSGNGSGINHDTATYPSDTKMVLIGPDEGSALNEPDAVITIIYV